jgi:hypothetical protein
MDVQLTQRIVPALKKKDFKPLPVIEALARASRGRSPSHPCGNPK